MGRADILRDTFTELDATHKGQLSSVSIVGPRRMGRSSLLYHICQTYTQHLPNADNYRFHYVDLQQPSYNDSPTSLLTALLDDAERAIEAHPQAIELKQSLAQLRQAQAVNLVLFEQALSGLRHCLLYTSPSPRDLSTSRMPSSA